jgi:hypothetical protein
VVQKSTQHPGQRTDDSNHTEIHVLKFLLSAVSKVWYQDLTKTALSYEEKDENLAIIDVIEHRKGCFTGKRVLVSTTEKLRVGDLFPDLLLVSLLDDGTRVGKIFSVD